MKKENNKPRKNKKSMNVLTLILIMILIVGIAVVTSLYFINKDKEENKEVAYTELLSDIENGLVEEIEMTTGSATLKVHNSLDFPFVPLFFLSCNSDFFDFSKLQLLSLNSKFPIAAGFARRCYRGGTPPL